jgi:hypothetical protein
LNQKESDLRLDGGDTRLCDQQHGPHSAPHRYLDTVQAAEFLAVSPRTLEDWRYRGGGPLFRKIGRMVRYTVRDLIAFADACIRTNTAGAAPA